MEKKTFRNLSLIAVAAALVGLGVLSARTSASFAARTHQEKLTEKVVLGKQVWHSRNCNDCHTILGIGAYYAPDLTKAHSRRGPTWLRMFLNKPESPDAERRRMPDQQLSPKDVTNVIAFLKWVDGIDTNGWPPKPAGDGRTIRVALTEPQSGKIVFTRFRCELCHAIGGVGGEVGPVLDDVGGRRDPLWIAAHLRDPQLHTPGSPMPAFPQIIEPEANALAGYLGSLKQAGVTK